MKQAAVHSLSAIKCVFNFLETEPSSIETSPRSISRLDNLNLVVGNCVAMVKVCINDRLLKLRKVRKEEAEKRLGESGAQRKIPAVEAL
jgi:hypothetical protein